MKIPENKYGFYTFFKEDGLYYFQFNDEEGEPILFSHGYQTEKSRDNGIKTVIRNADDDQHYEIKKASKGKFLFILKAGNHQEIGRSRIFAKKNEMQEKLELLKTVKKDVPVYNTLEAMSEEKAASSKKEKGLKFEEAQKMPRHKFSIIYYPGFELWKIIHDFTGDSKQFKTCDGGLIEDFLMEHVAGDKVEKTQPEKPALKGVATKKKKVIREAVELKLRTVEGQKIDKFARIGQFHEMEVLLGVKKEIPAEAAYDAEVMIKSFEDKDKLVIGKTKNQIPKDNRVLIPLYDPGNLKPGVYRLTASVYQTDRGEEAYDYEGDMLVMLN